MAIVKKGGRKGLVQKGGGLSALRAAKAKPSPETQEHLIITLDASFSMDDDTEGQYFVPHSGSKRKLWIAKDAAEALIRACSGETAIGIVQFASVAKELSGMTQNREVLVGCLGGYSTSGGTLIWTGLRTALDVLDARFTGWPGADGIPTTTRPKLRRIVLMTDGRDYSDGIDRNEKNIVLRRQQIQRAVDGKVIIDCVAFGSDADVEDLHTIADATGGVVKSASNAKELVKQFKQLEAGVRGLLTSGE